MNRQNKKTNVIRLTESDLHNMIMEAIDEMGTVKQNAYLRKLMGPRYKDEYDNLSVADSSKLIDVELKKANPQGNTGTKYEVVDYDNTKEFDTFREAKKYFDNAIDEYYELMGCSGDIRLVKISDICYKFYGRNSGYIGSLFLRKVKA